MRISDNLEPKKVFSFFEDISAIPHGSGNTKAISDYLVAYAESKNLEYHRDDMNNVIIIKPSSQGYEDTQPLIIQSHIDMVCEKTADCTKDMSVDCVELVLDGDLISAAGTTLGADDGIGVAYALALLDDDTLSHPRLEAVFTVDEEIGMLGAFGIDVSPLKGQRMLNLDCGCEKIFNVSCAGGITSKSSFSVIREDYTGDSINIKISGLSGGHSGVMISKGGANSNSLMGRLLCELARYCDFRLACVNGGFKDNAIPTQTDAVIVCTDYEKCSAAISTIEQIFKNEYSVTDPDLSVSVEVCEYVCPFDEESGKKVMMFLDMAPNGVQVMSSQIENLVQTSLNHAITSTDGNIFESVISIRSSVESQKYMLADRLKRFASYLGGTVETWGDYPGWEFKEKSEFRNLLSDVFKDKFGFEPQVEAVHAGLECGLFSGKIPGLDCISYGPNMWDVHTPNERLSVSSVRNVWEFLCEALKRMK